MTEFQIPEFSKQRRGPLFWLRPRNWWTGRRRVLRTDHSNEWRHEHLRGTAPPPPPGFPSDPSARTRPYSWLIDRDAHAGFSCVILGDTGEGDASQYALLPLIWKLNPDFMIINGDVAYPAGDVADYIEGFFAPYRGLHRPIWAVPGNHEYYSEGRGREFFEVFCSNIHATRWQEYGLALKPQPGSYWELSEPGVPVVVLGVDSGQAGALDESPGVPWLGLFSRTGDAAQHEWLDARLAAAESRDVAAVILFHIPKLVNGKGNDLKLARLHALVARYRCVKLVITAHIHNMQYYDPPTFGRYLQELTGQPPLSQPHYFVSGAGGAGIGSTHFGGPHVPLHRYPEPDAFDKLAREGEKIIQKLGLTKTLGGDILGALSGAFGQFGPLGARADADQMRMLSLLHLAFRPDGNVAVTPYYFDDIKELYDEAAIATVHVQEGMPTLSDEGLAQCVVQPSIVL